MKSPLYRSPLIYEKLIRVRLGKNFKKRLVLISKLLRGKRAIELGCGSGHNSLFLDCSYTGFDMNKKFVRYGIKKKRNVAIGDVFDVPLNNYDSIIMIDILHHLPDHKKLLKKALFTQKEVVVCEPFENHFNNRFVNIAFKKLSNWTDSDGINPPVAWYRKNKLKSFFKSFGKCDLYEIGENIIAHYPNNL